MTKKSQRSYGADTRAVSLTELLSEEASTWLSLAEIVVSSQPRRYFNPQKQEALVRSIQEHGILEPLIVHPLENHQYQLIAGERRYRAAVALNLKEVPVIVKNLTEKDALKIALTENLLRDDLNPVEETEGILQLLAIELEQTPEKVRQLLYQRKNTFEKTKATRTPDGNDLDQKNKLRDNVIPKINALSEEALEAVLTPLGYHWYSFTCNRLPLLNLPDELLQALRQGQLEYTKAKVIATVKEPLQRAELLKEAIAQELSLKEIKARIQALLSNKIVSSSPQQDLRDLTRRLNQHKLWQKDPRTWKKIEKLLAKVNSLVEAVEAETSNDIEQGISRTSLAPIFDEIETEPEE